MKVKGTRAYLAGQLLAKALLEIVNLMYQRETAYKFLSGLVLPLRKELSTRREEAKEQYKKRMNMRKKK